MSWVACYTYSSTVHPRACGEHFSRAAFKYKNDGSSPRLRGTYHPIVNQHQLCRFIPALAGNIRRHGTGFAHGAVHPRACGEHVIGYVIGQIFIGSSPRLRGTFHVVGGRVDVERFIPALAGNIVTGGLISGPQSVHPRACGEHDREVPGVTLDGGSSPRLRGTLNADSRGVFPGRFIPALAGNIFMVPLVTSKLSVHPRACGEHRRGAVLRVADSGSSPRLRGT